MSSMERERKILLLPKEVRNGPRSASEVTRAKHLKFYVISEFPQHIATFVGPTVSVPISQILSKSRDIIPFLESYGL